MTNDIGKTFLSEDILDERNKVKKKVEINVRVPKVYMDLTFEYKIIIKRGKEERRKRIY